MGVKLYWVKPERKPGVWIKIDPQTFEHNSFHRDSVAGELDAEIERVCAWCEETGFGTRMAYDMWKFKNRAELTAFLLKWG